MPPDSPSCCILMHACTTNLTAVALILPPLPPHIGAPLIIHPGRNESAPFEILDVLAAAGADLSRTVMSHLDRTILDDQKLLELAKRGCYLEYDLFGIECSHYQVGGEKCNLTLTLIVVRPDWLLFFCLHMSRA